MVALSGHPCSAPRGHGVAAAAHIHGHGPLVHGWAPVRHGSADGRCSCAGVFGYARTRPACAHDKAPLAAQQGSAVQAPAPAAAPQAEVFYCDPCEKEFKIESQYKAHLAVSAQPRVLPEACEFVLAPAAFVRPVSVARRRRLNRKARRSQRAAKARPSLTLAHPPRHPADTRQVRLSRLRLLSVAARGQGARRLRPQRRPRRRRAFEVARHARGNRQVAGGAAEELALGQQHEAQTGGGACLSVPSPASCRAFFVCWRGILRKM